MGGAATGAMGECSIATTGGATSAAGAWTSGTDGAGEGTGAATAGSGAAGAGVASVGGRAAIAAAASAARSDSTADLRSSAIDSVAVSFFSKRVCIASSLDPTFARAVMISPANLLRLLPAFVVTREDRAGERLEMDSRFGSDAALHPKGPRRAGRRDRHSGFIAGYAAGFINPGFGGCIEKVSGRTDDLVDPLEQLLRLLLRLLRRRRAPARHEFL
jgi:hypothetical protein